MKKTTILFLLVCVAGCGRPAASTRIEVSIDKAGLYTVDKSACEKIALSNVLRVKNQRAGGKSTLNIVCDPSLACSSFFPVLDQVAQTGINDVSFQIEGDPKRIDCSRPTVNAFQEIREIGDLSKEATVVNIMITAKSVVLDGKKVIALKDLGKELEGRTGTAIVKVHGTARVTVVHSVVSICEDGALKTWIFKL
jgi:hypothetical protein